MPRTDGYLPIAGYGLIGDCRSVALVGVDGSIDFCCLPRFDSPTLFGRLLDCERGGFWQIAPNGPHRSWQRYGEKTNVLETIFETDAGRACVRDFMPIEPATIREHARPHGQPRVIRMIIGLAGTVEMRQRVMLAPGYAAEDNPLHAQDGRLHGDDGTHHYCLTATQPLTDTAQTISVSAGDTVAIGLTVNDPGQCGPGVGSIDDVHGRLRQTQDFWWDWAERCTYVGPYSEHVIRSALVLKLMSYAPTGALVAAPTTSLPEWIGGPRNWDYRFTWLRDSSFILYALFGLGYEQEAHDFFDWLSQISFADGLQNLYTLDGTASDPEAELSHLSGYRDSAPVRTGNGAAGQKQLDTYGELLDAAYLYSRRGGDIPEKLWSDLHQVATLALENWRQPDASIWEVRGENRDYTYSKVMCWVAVDRALKIARRHDLEIDSARFQAARTEIREHTQKEGFSDELGGYAQFFGGDTVDAALLRLAQVGFLDVDDERLRPTIDAVDERLALGPLMRRYDPGSTDDGLSGGEGTFTMCGFWLVDGLAHAGELAEAQRRFEHLLACSSPLGLFSEEIDPDTGEMLGNFPQAFSHLALITAALNIERRRHGTLGNRARD